MTATNVINFVEAQKNWNEENQHLVTESLAGELAEWNGQLALLRGDNIYDVARLYFSSRGQHSLQTELTVDIPHGKTAEESADLVSEVVEKTILNPMGLRMVRAVMGRVICSNDNIVGALVNPGSSSTKATYDVLGYPVFCEWFEKRFKEELVGEPTPTLKRLRLDGDGNITTGIETIPHVDKVKDISSFYPYFKETPEEMADAFMKSKTSILLLIGPPGVGKSNYLLQMIRHIGFGEKIHLADRDDVLTHPQFPDVYRDMPAGSVMITEDSDKMVQKRTNGNATMSALLNATAGVVQRDSKLIISTNLEGLNDVDPALIRPGRCFTILKFKHLTADQAQTVRDGMGKPFYDFGNRNNITLAEALNAEEINTDAPRPQGIGFNS